jgi:hypothetical protein
MRWLMLTALVAGVLVGCAHVDSRPPAGVVVQEVKVPVPVPCDPLASARPAFPDPASALKAAEADLQLQLLYAGRKARDGYIGELEAALAACKAGGREPR